VIAGAALPVAFWFVCKRLRLADGLVIALALGLIASPHCKPYDAVVLIPLFVKVASLHSWEGILAYLGLTPMLYVMVLTGTPPIVLAGTSLVIVSTLAAPLQITANNKHVTVPAAMATP